MIYPRKSVNGKEKRCDEEWHIQALDTSELSPGVLMKRGSCEFL